MPEWNGEPALGTILAKMAELYTRAVRVQLAHKKQNADRVLSMFKGTTPK